MEFTLRPWRPEDAPSVARYADNPHIAANLRDVFPWPYSPQDAVSFIQSCLQADPAVQLSLAVDVGGEAVGRIVAFLEEDLKLRRALWGY